MRGIFAAFLVEQCWDMNGQRLNKLSSTSMWAGQSPYNRQLNYYNNVHYLV